MIHFPEIDFKNKSIRIILFLLVVILFFLWRRDKSELERFRFGMEIIKAKKEVEKIERDIKKNANITNKKRKAYDAAKSNYTNSRNAYNSKFSRKGV